MEYDCVLIRPDELYLKSEPVMRRMMKQLVHNIKVALKSNDVVFDNIIKQRLSILIRTPETNLVVEICKNLPGISIIMPAAEVGTNLLALNKTSLDFAKQAGLTKNKSFAVRAKRSSKAYKYSSKQLEEKVGAYIQTKTKAAVNLTNPHVTAHIAILNNIALISTKKMFGLGGLPVGVSGKIACLMTSKKTDLVAALLFMRRGCEILPINFRTSDQDYQKFLNNCATLTKFAYGTAIRPKGISGQLSISAAEKLAKNNDTKALSLSIAHLNKKHIALIKQANLPIFTPLIGLSENKIEEYRKAIFKKG